MSAVQAASGKARIAPSKVWLSRYSWISPVYELRLIPHMEKVGAAGWLTAERERLRPELALEAKLSAFNISPMCSALEDYVCTKVR